MYSLWRLKSIAFSSERPRPISTPHKERQSLVRRPAIHPPVAPKPRSIIMMRRRVFRLARVENCSHIIRQLPDFEYRNSFHHSLLTRHLRRHALHFSSARKISYVLKSKSGTIAIVGLVYVGLCDAATFASRTSYSRNRHQRPACPSDTKGKAPFHEPQLTKLS